MTADALFVPLSISWPCIEGSKTSTLTTEYFLHCFFIGIQSRREILLLLLDVIQRLINVILLPLSCQYMTVE
jgi:hypothetical protein